jgi:hypothetical protein
MILDAVFMAFMAVAERVLWALLIAQAITLLAISPSSYSQQALDVSILGIKPGEWLIGIVTWMLWYATGRLVTGADRTAERQLRAYVYIERTTFKRTATGVWEIIFQIKNFGQTPAHHVRVISIAKAVDWKKGKPDVPTPNYVETIGSMAPRGDFAWFESKLEGTATREEIEDGSRDHCLRCRL